MLLRPLALTAALGAAGILSTPAAAVSPDIEPAGPTTSSVQRSAESRPDAVAATAGASLDWKPCTGQVAGLQCATLEVPMDPADPAGKQISIAMSRLPHTSSAAKYRGVLLLNPGGPGGEGLSMPFVSNSMPKKVRSRYDWIGFDPRGVGASRPKVTCDPGYFGFNRPNYFPRPKQNLTAWLQRSRQYAQDCAANGPILEHMRTTNSVADMEAMRVALGAERINYFGFSYGTYLGQVYATMHPDRVDRMVFDGNIDPTRVFYKANLDQDIAMDANLRRWFSWIAQRNDQFRLGGSQAKVSRAYFRTQHQLSRTPAAGKIGASEWADIFNRVTYSKSEWWGLASDFSNYVRFDKAKPLVAAYKSGLDYSGDNSFAVYSAVQCVDAPWPTKWSTWARDNWRTYRKAPAFTWMNAWFNAQCRDWPAAPGPRFRVDGSDAPPILLFGSTYDGATPFKGSLRVRSLFPAASLVELKGSVTHSDSLGHRCSRDLIAKFLGSGKIPPRKAGPGPDATCPPRGRG